MSAFGGYVKSQLILSAGVFMILTIGFLLHAHVDAHQGQDGGQPGLIAQNFGLGKPPEQHDDPPDRTSTWA